MDQLPFTQDTIIFGLLCLCLGFVFYTSSIKTGFWSKFYSVVPTVLMCYLLPAILASVGIIDESSSNTYYVASRYLLPAALILMTLSIDLKAILNLGSKALVMFLTGTVGIVIGGPIAILIVSIFPQKRSVVLAQMPFGEVWPLLQGAGLVEVPTKQRCWKSLNTIKKVMGAWSS